MTKQKTHMTLSHKTRLVALLASTALVHSTAVLLGTAALAQSLPSGGQVAAGSATIGPPSAGSLTINQTSGSAVVNWQSFDVGKGNRVTFVQPDANAAILNRVTGQTTSTIAGQINANGQVYLINPNGIAITNSGTVKAGAFVASTLGISDDDFMTGKRSFTGNGASKDVTNAGTITINRGGYMALIGGTVANTGTITVPMGKAALGSGERATLDLSGDGFLQVAVPTKAKGDGALVDNSGRISARGGTVQLTAAAARDMARQAVNMSGTIEAKGVSGRSGDIVLSGGDGEVAISGKIDASSKRGTGGKVEVTGRKITLAGAKINASGKTGGGTINIGGNRQGKGPLQHAETLTVDANTVINADAVTTGNGGNVVLWSDDLTRFAGTITAKGGAVSGNGGEVEVSGKAKLSYTGLTDLTAAHGSVGNLLLDPYNVTISTATDSNSSAFTASGNDSVINVNTLTNALATANVTVSTGGAGSAGSQAGTITVAAPVAWNAPTTLTLAAASDININSAITAAPGGLTLASGGVISASAAVNVNTFVLASGSWLQNSAALPALLARDFRITGGASFLRVTGGDGSSATPYTVADVYGLQGIGSSSTSLNASWRLANNIDASATTNWNAGAGFVPIGVDRNGNVLNNSNGFNGYFDGQNHTIYNLKAAAANYAGLFGYAGTGSRITRVGLVGGSVYGGTDVGGLVGYSAGSVTSSFATNAVNGGSDNVGGLVGYNRGSVSTSYATGTVVGNFNVGGLVGSNAGSVTQSYATGAANGYSYIGDLVGVNGGNIAYTFTSGRRPGYGLVGLNYGTVSNSFWDTDTSDQYFGTSQSGQGTFSARGLGRLDMQDPFTFINAGWDFTSVWGKSTSGANNGYMMLRSLSSGLYDDYVKIGSASRTYGESNSTISGAILSGVGIANVTFNWGSAIKATINAGTYNYGDAGVISLIETGSRMAYVDYSQNLTIGRRPLTITAQTQTKIYGDADPTLTYTTTGTVNNDTLSGSLATATGQYSDVGRYAITQGSLDNANYAINYVGADLTINQRALTVTANAGQSFTYGDTLSPAYSVTSGSLLNGDALSGGLGGLTSTSGVGTYTLTRGTLDNTNYAITFAGNTATVTARPITVTADAQSKAYGDTNPILTYTVGGAGLVNGDTLSGSLATSAVQYSNVGGYAITQGALAASNNYALTYIGANLTVTQRPLTVIADALSRTYGDINPALTYSTNGLINGDTLSGSLATLAAQYSGVGGYAITQGSLAASGNYALTYVGADLTVNRRVLTVAADAQSKAYGDANPTLTYTVGGAGLVNGDSLSGALMITAGQYSNVGTYGITIGSLGNSNYSISYAGADLTINPRALTVTADALSKAYGDANPTLTYTVGGAGLVNGDTLSGALVTTAGQYSNVGTYTISQGTLGNSNYSISFTGADLAINKRALTVTADAQSRAYGDANPTLTYTVGGAGLVNGDSLSGALSTSAMQHSNVGTYAISQGSLGNANYTITYSDADLTVTPRAITVVANAASRAYGDANPALTYAIGGAGLVNGDTLSGVLATMASGTSNVGAYGITQGTLAASGNYALTFTAADLTVSKRAITVAASNATRIYGDANPALSYTIGGAGLVNGDGLTGGLATSAVAASGVGSYGIGQGSLAASGNYDLTFLGGTLSVTPRAITVAANGANRTYGDADPVFTYVATGLVNGDTLAGDLSSAANRFSNVGSYTIGLGTLGNANYAISYTGARLTITPRLISAIANNASRAAGAANPLFSYTIAGGGLVNGDRLFGQLASAADLFSIPGSYAIDQGSLAASANYDLSFVRGVLTVTAPPSSPTADLASAIVPRSYAPDAAPPLPPVPADDRGRFSYTDEGRRVFLTDPRFAGTVVCLGDGTGCLVQAIP